MYDFVQLQYGQQIAKNLGQITGGEKKTQTGNEQKKNDLQSLKREPCGFYPILLFRTDDVTFFMAQFNHSIPGPLIHRAGITLK